MQISSSSDTRAGAGCHPSHTPSVWRSGGASGCRLRSQRRKGSTPSPKGHLKSSAFEQAKMSRPQHAVGFSVPGFSQLLPKPRDACSTRTEDRTTPNLCPPGVCADARSRFRARRQREGRRRPRCNSPRPRLSFAYAPQAAFAYAPQAASCVASAQRGSVAKNGARNRRVLAVSRLPTFETKRSYEIRSASDLVTFAPTFSTSRG